MDNEKLKKYLEKGTEIAGGALGGAIGLIDGRFGGVLGGGMAVAITIGIKEFFNRQLSNRQEIRIAASAVYVIDEIRKRIEQGDTIRNDSFFVENNGRSSAEELFEGVLLKCKDQYQEKKIFYISKIFEKAIFDDNISSETANQILSLVESFTYRKLCVISFFLRKNEFRTDILMQDPYSIYPNAKYSIELEILKQDILDLINLGIVVLKNRLMLSKNDVVPFQIELTNIGQLIASIMDLQLIPLTDLNLIYLELQYKEEFGPNRDGEYNGKKR